MAKIIIKIDADNVGPGVDKQQLAATLREVIANLTGMQPSVNVNDRNNLSVLTAAKLISQIKNKPF